MRLPLAALAFLAASALAADPPPVVKEEGQPVAANADRVQKALDVLGTPLPKAVETALAAAVKNQDAADVQKALDPLVGFVVTINPESRVKAAEGPKVPKLQQAGWTPVLVKVLNEGSIKKKLNVTSPQAGPLFGGAGRNEQDPKADPKGDAKRFAQVEFYSAQPLKADLSGLKVEYAVLLLYSSEEGKREITVGFDVGQGTQDLGFRGEVAVLFEVQPAVAVKLSVKDFDGKPTVGRFTFTDAAGHVFPPKAKRLRPDLFFQDQIYRQDGGTVLLPPGELTVQYGRGPEYKLATKKFTVAKDAKLEVKLERWVNPADYGFYSGDHHIHAAGCAHYTSPTEGVMPEDMHLYVKGEGLNVGCCLTWGPCYDFQRKFFAAGPWEKSEAFTVLKYDVEVSGFGSQALGHVNLLNLRDQTYPGSDGTKTKGWPTWTTPLMKWAKEQGAVTGYAHSANGLNVNAEASTRRLFVALAGKKGDFTKADADAGKWPLPEPFDTLDADKDGKVTEVELRQGVDRQFGTLPNLSIPEMGGIGAQEVCVTTAMGVCDFLSAMDTDRVAEWNCWYHLLNCGFPLKISGETDFPCVSGGRVGQGRVYVQLGKPDMIEYGKFCKGIAEGRSYVSDGYAHCFDTKVGTGGLGDTVKAKAGEKLAVAAKVAFDPDVTLGTAIGGKTVGTDKRTVELVVNGKVIDKKEVPADRKVHEVSFDVAVEKSCWVALRCFPQMHTNPVFVSVDGKPIRASKESAKWCVGVIEQLWKVREKDIREGERKEAEKTFKEAIEIYKKIADEAK